MELNIEVNKKLEPKTLNSPKNKKTKRSPKPIYPYAFSPTVYLMADIMAAKPKAINKIKLFMSSPKDIKTNKKVKMKDIVDNKKIPFFISFALIPPLWTALLGPIRLLSVPFMPSP